MAMHVLVKETLKGVFATLLIVDANVRKQKMLVLMTKNVTHGNINARGALEEILVAQRIISVV